METNNGANNTVRGDCNGVGLGEILEKVFLGVVDNSGYCDVGVLVVGGY